MRSTLTRGATAFGAALFVLTMFGSASVAPTAGAAVTPDLGVSPHANLRDHQAVVVSGIQYAAGTPLRVQQCAPSLGRCRQRATDAVADAQGMYAVRDFEVRRLVTRPDGAPIDCATIQCRIVVTARDGSTRSLSRILTFDPSASFDPPPTLTVTPAIDLPSTAELLATYRRFAPGERLTIRVCRVGTARDVCEVGADDFASATGGADFLYEGHRRITDAAGYDHDCADPIGLCVLEVVGESSGDVAAATLAFDASTPLSILTVADGTGLPFRGSVTAHGRGLPPNTAFSAATCASGGSGPSACFDRVQGTSDAAGTLDLVVPFRRRVHTATVDITGVHSFRYDCAQPTVRCAVRFTGGGVSITAPVSFDPSAPIPPPPTVTVQPSRDLAARQTVGITGSGFLPNHSVRIEQCDSVLDFFGTEVCSGSTTTSDASGRITTSAIVRRVFGTTTDCAAAVGRCVVRATTDATTFGDEPEATETVRAALGFDPTAPPVSPPVTVTPSTGLGDRQTVTVAGSDFPADTRIQIVTCRTTPTWSSRDCELTEPTTFLTDATGAFSQPYVVRQLLETGTGYVDCSVAPQTCVLAVAGYADASVSTLVPISFASHGPTPVVTARSRSITEPTDTNHSTKIDIELSEVTDHQVRVAYKVPFPLTGTASYGDYANSDGSVTFAPGQTRVTIRIDIVGDRLDEPSEWFALQLFHEIGATVGPDARITIRDDDPAPTVRLADATVRERDVVRYALVPVRLSNPSAWPVTVHFATHQYSARLGSDFADTTGTLVIPPNTTTANIAVVILGDQVPEGAETLLVTIERPTRSTIGDGDAVLTITDDD